MKDNKVIMRLLIVAVVAIIGFVIIKIFPNPNESETETIYCGANNSMPIKVFKNPTKAFPAFAQNFNNKIDVVNEIMDSLSTKPKTTLSLGLKSQIVQLKEKLNQENIRMEMIMKSNFFAFNSSPCDPKVREDYYSLLKLIIEKTVISRI